MQFDIVIGNPPYNRGLDLDFVNIGFDLCNEYCIMVVPAKWQTTADDYRGCASVTIDYRNLREKLVKHMRKVVFYPEANEIFEIRNVEGITYFILDKNKTHDKCTVVNKCKSQPIFNSTQYRSIHKRESLHNIGAEIIESLGNYKIFKFHIEEGKKFSVSTGNKMDASFDRNGRIRCVSNSTILDNSKKETDIRGAVDTIFNSDNLSECESFISWISTKFTRFFVMMNLSKQTNILTDDYFRFVPAPPSEKFDHIYTDEELYKAFNLKQKYIDVIEDVLKDVKIDNQ